MIELFQSNYVETIPTNTIIFNLQYLTILFYKCQININVCFESNYKFFDSFMLDYYIVYTLKI